MDRSLAFSRAVAATLGSAAMVLLLATSALAQTMAPRPTDAPASGAAEEYCGRDLGMWFYCQRSEPIETEQEPTPPKQTPPVAPEIQELEAYQKALEEARSTAVWRPTPETVEHYYRLQQIALDNFAAAWSAEIKELPETITTRLHVVTGLLLPIWSRLPQETTRVYRLEANGERIIGRVVLAEEMDAVCRQFGLCRPEVSVNDAWTMVLRGGGELQLAEGVTVRRSLVAGVHRVEVRNFSHHALSQFKAMGLNAEIIQFQTRLFIPANDAGRSMLEGLLQRHPLVDAQPRLGRAA